MLVARFRRFPPCKSLCVYVCVWVSVCVRAALLLHAFNTLSLSDSLQGPAEDLQQLLKHLSPLCILLVSCVPSNPSPPVLRSPLFPHVHPIPCSLPPSPPPPPRLLSIPSHAASHEESVSCFGGVCNYEGFSHRDETDENTACRRSELLTGWKWMSQR